MIESLDVETPQGPVRVDLYGYDSPRDSRSGVIFAYMGDRELWSISPAGNDDFFVEINLREKNIEAATWNGFLYVIETYTGIVRDKYLVK